MMATQSAALNATRRRAEMAQLADGQRVDVAVIGGGITGAGVALDAASRGMSTVLLERCDLANGTSRWSSKLAHGGLRYLRQGEVGVAWESARDRWYGCLQRRCWLPCNSGRRVRSLPAKRQIFCCRRGCPR